jgi:hypothetical protein
MTAMQLINQVTAVLDALQRLQPCCPSVVLHIDGLFVALQYGLLWATPPAEEPVRGGAWDPDPASSRIESSRCRALLLEIVKRASHDYILYRMSRKMDKRQLAEDAYIWLFEEDERHARARERRTSGRTLTSFLTICELLDLDPESVRRAVRQTDIRSIVNAGRPAEHRRRRDEQEAPSVPDSHQLVDFGLDELEHEDPMLSHYENHFAARNFG